MILRAFSSGCSALTGLEAIANGVPAFKPPKSKNAATTIAWMAGILATFFVGLTMPWALFVFAVVILGGLRCVSLLIYGEKRQKVDHPSHKLADLRLRLNAIVSRAQREQQRKLAE